MFPRFSGILNREREMAKQKKGKRYFFSVVEEGIMNKKYQHFRGGRIEVYDTRDKSGYACYEARFFIPEEFMDSFRETWDFKESDEMPFIRWDYSEVEKDKEL